MNSASGMKILLEAHTGPGDSADSIAQVVRACARRDIEVWMTRSVAEIVAEVVDPLTVTVVSHESPIAAGTLNENESDNAARGVAVGADMVLALGGDGTFLRASEIARAADVPVLGINLGHVGFLAESEFSSLPEAIDQLADGDYHVVNRMTIDVEVFGTAGEIGTGWALNEASIEKLERRGVLETTLEVDGRPVSSFGCDGVLVSTPTGSTAYAFSAGGPIVWPDLDAILVVPNNAHALFARPMVVAPDSVVAVETAPRTSDAIVALDGRREISVPAGARVTVRSGHRQVKWVRLDQAPFTDRLVRKFKLPVTGWRGMPTPSQLDN